MEIIALGGTLSSGKDTVAKYLETRGFKHFSLSDELRGMLHERDTEPTRDNMNLLAKEVRTKNGNDYLVIRVLEKAEKGGFKKIILSSFHHPHEVERVKNLGAKFLVVDAPIELRFQRAKARERIGDGTTFKEFNKQEERERKSLDSGGQQLDAIISLADYRIENDGTEEELYKKVDWFLESYATQ